MKVIPPNSCIGILGGGQLARMTAMAAARLGYRCHIFCPEEHVPALLVSAQHTCADYDDVEALEVFAKSVDVVTLEWENVPLKALEIIGRHVAVHPNAKVLEIAQDRRLEKLFAQKCGVGTAPFSIIESEKDLMDALAKLSGEAILKTARMGYDGKGQRRLNSSSAASEVWRDMGNVPCVLEGFVHFEREVSVIVARRADGVMKSYPLVENIHKNHILYETSYPVNLDEGCTKEAILLAEKMAENLGVIGLLAVELFVLTEPDEKGQRVIMNEVAPRPHNSGHWTIDACACNQFEQLVRAVCGLPLGDTTPHSAATMRNLLGDEILAWETYLAIPQACLHLYGKAESRSGRKMGHVTFLKS